MMYLDGEPLPQHVQDAIPEGFPGTIYEVRWQGGNVVVSAYLDDFDNIAIVPGLVGVSAHDSEVHAVEMAIASFQVGYAQHRLCFGIAVTDDEIRDALAAATMRGDMDIADLLDAAVERGIGPAEPAPAIQVGGYRH